MAQQRAMTNQGWNGYRQSRCRGNQRGGNTSRQQLRVGLAGGEQLIKHLDQPHHGTENTQQRTNLRNNTEPRQMTL